jgi:hypothetical protein
VKKKGAPSLSRFSRQGGDFDRLPIGTPKSVSLIGTRSFLSQFAAPVATFSKMLSGSTCSGFTYRFTRKRFPSFATS